MARKTKDLEEEPKTVKKATTKKAAAKKDTKKKTTTKKTAAKKETTKKTAEKKVATKKTTEKKAVAKKVTAKKATATAKKAAVKKATVTKKASAKKSTTTKKSDSKEVKPVKKAVTKKAVTKKTTAKKTTTKKIAAKKESTKKTTTKKTSTKKATTKKASSTKRKSTAKVEEIKDFQPEYYDLPYAYNKTVVKVLAQTPKVLFVYWEISEDDRNNYIKAFGERFFEETKPILVVHNHTMNYSFEIDINDFANSWYIHINDSNCTYTVELGRRPLPTANQFNNYGEVTQYIPYYVYVTSSNIMDAPNNRMLFDLHRQFIPFRNVKTGEITYKDIRQFKFISNLGIMTIAELYKVLYPDENFEYDNLLANPSSGGLSSSGTFSSRFK